MARRKRDMAHGTEANQSSRRPLRTARRAQRRWLETKALRASRRFIAPRIALRLCARNGLLTQRPRSRRCFSGVEAFFWTRLLYKAGGRQLVVDERPVTHL